MIGELTQRLRSEAKEWGLPASGRWDYLFYNNYHPHITTINLLWFHDGGRRPAVVTKLFRRADVPRREFENLRRARAWAPDCAPEPLYFGPREPFWELWMRGAPGVRLSGVRNCSAVALHSLVERIANLHRAFAANAGGAGPDRRQRIVTAPLEAVAVFGASEAVREGCRRLAAAADDKWIASLPVIPQHGDLYLGNLLSNGDEWHIVDWESFGTVDLPFYDLATLLLSALFEAGRTPAEWDAALVARIPDLVRLYCTRLNLTDDHRKRLLPLSLVNWFYLQQCDGRTEFTQRMYQTISNYFENQDAWERVFRPRG